MSRVAGGRLPPVHCARVSDPRAAAGCLAHHRQAHASGQRIAPSRAEKTLFGAVIDVEYEQPGEDYRSGKLSSLIGDRKGKLPLTVQTAEMRRLVSASAGQTTAA